jgi:hypothetical protein
MALYRNDGTRLDLADLSPDARVPRPLWQIYQDVAALTAAQKQAIWADLTSGPPSLPKKYLRAVGPNAAAVNALDWAVTDSGAAGASLQSAQTRMISMICQDYPDYLVNPAFDPTINVPGDGPAGGAVTARVPP